MSKRRNIVIALIGALVLPVTLRADMMPLFPAEGGYGPPSQACDAAVPQRALYGDMLADTGFADPDLLSIKSLLTQDNVEQTRARRPVLVLTEGQNSFGLCLYTLLGLGLCKSVPLVRKFSFGCVPQWYHDGGPAQIGHRLAIAPDCLCRAPVCFVQPDRPPEEYIARYYFATVVALWRNCQSTPAVCASRAPPNPA